MLKYLEQKSSLLIWLIVFIFFILYSTLSIVRHSYFQSGGFDLGLYDQAVWQYSRFVYPFNTIKMKMILGDHLTFTLAFLAPLYWIWNDVRALLIFQAFWISLSVFPIYKYILLRGVNKISALILSGLYISFYGFQFGVLFDFHPVVIGAGMLPWILYYWELRRWKILYFLIVILLLTQENMGLAVISLSLIWFFQGKYRKKAILLGIVGVGYTLLAFRLLEIFSGSGVEYIPDWPKNAIEFVERLFDNGEKKRVWLYTFFWYSFLPLASPGSLLAVFMDISQYFVTGEKYSRMWSPFTHHRFMLSSYLLVGAVDVLRILKSRGIKISVIVWFMAICAVFQQLHYNFALNKLLIGSFWQRDEWIDNNYDVLEKVPSEARVATQQSLAPHLSHRRYIYILTPQKIDAVGWWLEYPGKPEYIVVDAHPGVWLTMLLTERQNFVEALTNMEKAGVIKLEYKKGDSVIYKLNKL